MSSSPGRIQGFDGLRALAFLLVFVSHKTQSTVTERYGSAGVWMFFVLSGFLITRILATSRSEIEGGRATPSAALWDFYLRRTLRIFPVYYLFLCVIAVMDHLGILKIGNSYRQICDWLFLSNIYIEFYNWGVVGHLWSLAVEEQFYLLFAPLALLLPLRRLPHVCAALVGVSVAAHLGFLARQADHIHFDANSFVNFGLLGLGGLAGLAADRPLPKVMRSDLAFCLGLAGFLVIPALTSTPDWLHAGRLGGLLVALSLIQIYQNQGGRAVAILNSAPLRRLGLISYGAYLFHPIISCRGAMEALGFHGLAAQIAGGSLDFALTILVSTLSWRYFETPIRNLARRGRLAAQTSAPAS